MPDLAVDLEVETLISHVLEGSSETPPARVRLQCPSMRRSWLMGKLVLTVALLAASCTSSGDDDNDADGSSPDGIGAESPETNGDADGSATAASGIPTPGAGTTIVAARANWSTGYFQNAVLAALMGELGYEVTDPAEREFPPGNGYVALAQGDIDYWADGWFPNHDRWLEPTLTDGTAVGDNLTIVGQLMPAAGLEGFLITRTVAEANDIQSLQQINDDPTLVALFDIDGNGLADLFGCPDEWTCDDVATATLERNGWTNLELRRDRYDTMVAETLTRVEAGQPVIQYSWSPSGFLADLTPGDNVLWLSLGSIDLVCDGTAPCQEMWDFQPAASVSLGDACTQDPCITGWESASIRVAANSSFLESNPVAAALLELVTLEVDDVVALAVRFNRGENTEQDVKTIAAEWIGENRAQVDAWLLEAAAAS